MPRKTSLEKELEIIELSKQNLCVAQIAKIVGVTDKVVARVGKENDLNFSKASNASATSEEKEMVINLFREGYRTTDISHKTGRSLSSIGRILRANGYNIPRNGITMTENMRKDVANMYISGVSSVNIAKKYNLCDRTIVKILKKEGIEIRTSGSKAIIENENFFEVIDTEEKAYYLGLITADGNVRINDRGQCIFQMMLQSSDKYILQNLSNLLGLKTSRYDENSHRQVIVSKPLYYSKNKDEYSIQCYSSKVFCDLKSHGIVPRKTFKTTFATTIPHHLMKHYVRGYFDGDGCVTGNEKSLRVIFYGQRNFLDDLKSFLDEELPMLNKNLKIFDKPTLSMLTYGARANIIDLYHYLYDDATIYLDRKKKKFDNFIKTYASTEVTLELKS